MPGAEDEPFRLGVNYWPAETAMDWFQAYDPAVTRRDFHRMRGAGLDSARVFLRWEDAQPSPATIDTAMLDRLIDVADAGEEADIALIITLFVGHMSGANWIPSWATGEDHGDRRFRVISEGHVHSHARLRNWYSDSGVTEAQERLAGATARALAGHAAIWAWDLGNENSNCTVPPDAASGEAWLERMSSAIRANDPGRPITIGIHMEDIEEDRAIGPLEAARWCDIVSMHGYPIYADWSAGPADDRLVPFLAEITGWLAFGAPVLFEEFGLPTSPVPAPDSMCVSEDAAATYIGQVLDGLHEAGCIGALLWCYSDYTPALYGVPPLDTAVHERTFGLWRADGSPKPSLIEITARTGMKRAAASNPGAWLDISQETFTSDRKFHLGRLYRRYRAALGHST